MVIVVGVDDSREGEAAARRAVAEAECWGGELHVVHVTHVPGPLLAALDQVPTGVEELEEAQRQAVWERIRPVLSDAGVEVHTVDRQGYPPDTLVEYAAGVGADLIVVGTRGRGDLAALVLGSTSHRVTHLADCDVLVVKPPPEIGA